MTEKEQQQNAVEARRRYQRTYRAANRDRVRTWNQRYWIRRGQREAAETDANERRGCDD